MSRACVRRNDFEVSIEDKSARVAIVICCYEVMVTIANQVNVPQLGHC